jgi:hypothetical protein
MTQYATKDDVQEIVEKAVDKAVNDLSEVIRDFANHVDERFTKVEADIAELNTRYDHLLETIDRFLKRLDDLETDNTARDAQLARLERWIEQVAAKTGVKLEY